MIWLCESRLSVELVESKETLSGSVDKASR